MFGHLNRSNSPMNLRVEDKIASLQKSQAMGRNSSSYVGNYFSFEARESSFMPMKRTSSTGCYPLRQLDQSPDACDNIFEFNDLEDMNLNDFNDFYESGQGLNAAGYDKIERPQNPFYKNFEGY